MELKNGTRIPNFGTLTVSRPIQLFLSQVKHDTHFKHKLGFNQCHDVKNTSYLYGTKKWNAHSKLGMWSFGVVFRLIWRWLEPSMQFYVSNWLATSAIAVQNTSCCPWIG